MKTTSKTANFYNLIFITVIILALSRGGVMHASTDQLQKALPKSLNGWELQETVIYNRDNLLSLHKS